MTKFLIVTFLSFTFCACNQNTVSTDKDKERIDKVCDTFMNQFSHGKTHDALKLLKQNAAMSPASVDTLQATIDNQKNDFFTSYGRMVSYEFITDRKIKDFIVDRFYILKFQKYYLKFDFTLYKASSRWTIIGFKYDEDLTGLFN